MKIEDFKDEICESLQNYNNSIEQLKSEIEGYSMNVE